MDRSRQIKLFNQLRETNKFSSRIVIPIGHENSGKSFIQFTISNNRIKWYPS